MSRVDLSATQLADTDIGAHAATKLSGAEVRRAIGGLMLVLALATLDGSIVGPALPRIVSDLGGLAHLSWVVTAFAVASTATTPLYGKLSDMFGRRPAFFVSIGVFIAGSVLCGAAGSMLGLILARVVQGVGAGGLMTLSQTAIADLVSPRERGRYQGMVAGVFGVCSVAGPLAGGVITDQISWPWIFYINLPLGAVALAMLMRFLPAQAGRRGGAIDWAGFGLVIAGTCALMLMLSWGGNAYPWASPPVLGLAVASAVCFGLLLVVEPRAAAPAIPPVLLADRVFAVGTTVVALTAGSMFGALVFVPLYFQAVMGADASEAGLRMAPMMGGLVMSSLAGGRLVTRTGRYKIFPIVGLCLTSATFIAMAWAIGAQVSANALDGLLAALGMGVGLVMPNITTAVQSAVAARDVGIATATLGFFRSLGGALGVAVAGMIFAAHLHGQMQAGAHGSIDALRALPPGQMAMALAAYRQGLSAIFATAACVSAFCLAVVLFLPERPLRGRGG